MTAGGLWPLLAGALADAVLALHVGVVAFVVLGLPMVMVGGRRGWAWVRRRGWRIAHVVLMLVIALQAWLGVLCPLTTWEQALRRQAGQAAYDESFIAHWLGRLIYFDMPPWVFIAAYTAFALAVLWAWRAVPPQAARPARG